MWAILAYVLAGLVSLALSAHPCAPSRTQMGCSSHPFANFKAARQATLKLAEGVGLRGPSWPTSLRDSPSLALSAHPCAPSRTQMGCSSHPFADFKAARQATLKLAEGVGLRGPSWPTSLRDSPSLALSAHPCAPSRTQMGCSSHPFADFKAACQATLKLAEGVGFEPTDGFPSPVFKTGALNRSATLPFALLESSSCPNTHAEARCWSLQVGSRPASIARGRSSLSAHAPTCASRNRASPRFQDRCLKPLGHPSVCVA